MKLRSLILTSFLGLSLAACGETDNGGGGDDQVNGRAGAATGGNGTDGSTGGSGGTPSGAAAGGASSGGGPGPSGGTGSGGTPMGSGGTLVGSGGTSGAIGEKAVVQLRACGVIGEGRVNVDDPDDVDDCIAQCLVDHPDCGVLTDLMCAPLLAQVLHAAEPAIQCINGCSENQSQFNCVTGGETVPASFVCDSEPDCSDGSDEVDCTEQEVFACGDGALIPANWECDTQVDCDDGSDEANGCAPLLCN